MFVCESTGFPGNTSFSQGAVGVNVVKGLLTFRISEKCDEMFMMVFFYIFLFLFNSPQLNLICPRILRRQHGRSSEKLFRQSTTRNLLFTALRNFIKLLKICVHIKWQLLCMTC